MYKKLDEISQDYRELTSVLMNAIKDERYHMDKYKIMIEMTKNEKIKEQLEFAYQDEGKHLKMFQYIFYQFNGKEFHVSTPKIKEYTELKTAIEDCINIELAAVEIYRGIQAMLPTLGLRDMLFEIITDEQEHATRLTYIYSILKES